MEQKPFYCYSINLLNFMRKNGIRNISKGHHTKTKKYFWTFEKTPEFFELLTEFTNNKIR